MIIQSLTNSFKSEMLKGVHDLETDVLKMALYTGAATLTPQTTAYSSTDEVVASGYTAGGVVLTGVTIMTQTVPNTQPATVYVDFNDAVFTGAITARGALIYNSSKADKAVAVISFGADKTSTTTFTVVMPANTAADALIRFP
jgi:hypothetical protein